MTSAALKISAWKEEIAKIEVIPFSHAEHKSVIVDWLIGHQMGLKESEELPSTGFIAKKDGEFIAAGFLRFLEASKTAMVDGLISNPKVSGKIRHVSIDLICSLLIDTAKKLKLNGLVAFSGNSAVLKRAAKYDFYMLNDRMIVLSLGD